MEQPFVQIYQSLRQLEEYHSRLLKVVQTEHKNLVQADLKSIESITAVKQRLLEKIHQMESKRLKATAELALLLKKPLQSLTLSNLLHFIEMRESSDPGQSEGREPGESTHHVGAAAFKQCYDSLKLFIERINEQNTINKKLLEKSLEHIHQMKKNILVDASIQSNTYTAQGQKTTSLNSSRLISKEV